MPGPETTPAMRRKEQRFVKLAQPAPGLAIFRGGGHPRAFSQYLFPHRRGDQGDGEIVFRLWFKVTVLPAERFALFYPAGGSAVGYIIDAGQQKELIHLVRQVHNQVRAANGAFPASARREDILEPNVGHLAAGFKGVSHFNLHWLPGGKQHVKFHPVHRFFKAVGVFPADPTRVRRRAVDLDRDVLNRCYAKPAIAYRRREARRHALIRAAQVFHIEQRLHICEAHFFPAVSLADIQLHALRLHAHLCLLTARSGVEPWRVGWRSHIRARWRDGGQYKQ